MTTQPQDRALNALQPDEDDAAQELPGIDTPVGGEQRLKLEIPTPDTTLTLGAIGNSDAAGHKFGPGGFNLRTVENFAAEVLKQTIIDSDDHTIIHTKTTLTEVAGEKIHLSTNGDYQLGTVGGVSITAAEGAGFADPEFTVDPQMAIPAPPTIDTKGPRETLETVKAVWKAAWKIYDAKKGGQAVLKLLAERKKAAEGIKEEKFAGKQVGIAKAVGLAKKAVDLGMYGYAQGVAAAAHFFPEDKSDEPGKPKITLYGHDGISMMSPWSISMFGGMGCGIESPYSVSLKAGLSASMKSIVESTVFGAVSAKLESNGIAAVKGKYTLVDAKEGVAISAGKTLVASGKELVSIDSDDSVRVSAKKKLRLMSADAVLGGAGKARVLGTKLAQIRSLHESQLVGDKKVLVESKEDIEIKVKKTGLLMTDGDLKLGCNNKYGVHVTNSKANIGSSSDYVACGNSKINIVTRGTAKVNGSTIKLG